MTREHAAEIMRREKAFTCGDCIHPQEMGYCEKKCLIPQAYDMAIEALESDTKENNRI